MAAISPSPGRPPEVSALDMLGYGMRGHAASRATPLLISVTVVLYFGLLPILWRHAVTFLPSIVWTGIATCLLCSTAISARHSTTTLPATTGFVALFCLLYPVFGWISYLAWGRQSTEREELLIQIILIMVLALSLYLTGAAVRSHHCRPALWAAWTTTLVYVLLNARQLDLQSLYLSSLETGIVLNYQLMGDAFAICSAILITRIRQARWQWAFAALCTVIMFMIPSRSAAFFGFLSLLTALLLFGNFRSRLTLLVLSGLVLLGVQSGAFAEIFEGTRFESAFTPDKADNSWHSRQEAVDFGISTLKDNPFFGEWAFQLTDLKYAGAYIHSALDVWAQAGLIPFLLFLGIWATLLTSLLHVWRASPQLAREAGPVLMFAALSWVLSRNVTNAALFFCLGHAAATLSQAYQRPDQRP